METIQISIINTKLEDLGLDQDDEYTDLHFRPKELMGYWIVKDGDEEPEICAYIGAHKFFLKYTQENEEKLHRILTNNY